MIKRTVLDATRELLRELGLTTVFGNPGTTEVPFLTDWPDDFDYILGLQESAVVAMADAYAQATRQAVLVNLHSAGGVGHGLGSLFNAYRNRTPLIIVAGQQNRALLPHDPFLGAMEAPEFPKPYVKWSIEPACAEDVPAALARAYHVATQAPSGPVFVSVPADDWTATTERPIVSRPRIRGFAPDPEAVDELVAALETAQRPAIVVGGAVDQDGAVVEAVALAERLNAGVWVAPMSYRCSFPEDHPLFQGFLDPERGAVADALEKHDLVVVLGAPAFTYHVDRGRGEAALPPLFIVSDDEQVLARAFEGTGIRATPKLGIRALLNVIERSTRPAPKPLERPAKPGGEKLTGELVYSTLAEVLPDNAIVVEETPSHRGILHDHLPITALDTGFLTMASGTLGYGVPGAVGAALARPDRKVVGVVGDGSSMYGIQALWTAARQELPVTIVIMDNTEYAAVRILGETIGGAKLPGTELGGIDFAALAASMGCHGVTITEPNGLAPGLTAALADPRPTLVHVKVAPSDRTLY
ncbi:benzoylformate decarboxylase [Amycolatopsis lexingtonensis]|uniref:Benzoylformate decarboxylase n=1 Tax=Amycolatopsis lexingtonensis TaxID=218822 RepID=A0ABR9IBH3_9PSEU|nr:benzoylformate decarboxylase [Amycolatopsis lexingtonensis]MBE1500532.1 benzoylformate decarboxylase [Amycolatopsis lexingtonensis]